MNDALSSIFFISLILLLVAGSVIIMVHLSTHQNKSACEELYELGYTTNYEFSFLNGRSCEILMQDGSWVSSYDFVPECKKPVMRGIGK